MRKMKHKTKVLLTIAAVMVVTSVAFAITGIFTVTGTLTVPTSDPYVGFKDFPEGYTGPVKVEFQELALKPGDVVPWHYHEGLVYVVLTKGTLTVQDKTCSYQNYGPGSGFIESPGFVHRALNESHGEVILYWAVAYPSSKSDVIFTTNPGCTN